MKLHYIDFDLATTPRNGMCLVDRWWIVHPEHGLAVWGEESYQCNLNRAICDMLVKRHPGHEVCFIPAAYVPLPRP